MSSDAGPLRSDLREDSDCRRGSGRLRRGTDRGGIPAANQVQGNAGDRGPCAHLNASHRALTGADSRPSVRKPASRIARLLITACRSAGRQTAPRLVRSLVSRQQRPADCTRPAPSSAIAKPGAPKGAPCRRCDDNAPRRTAEPCGQRGAGLEAPHPGPLPNVSRWVQDPLRAAPAGERLGAVG